MLSNIKFKALLFITIFFSIIQFALADDFNQLYSSGNAEYKKGNYQQALNFYQKIAAAGQVSDGLYYNIANCYFKLNQEPKAILYYERVLKINSSHTDAIHNLKFARLKTVDKINTLPVVFYKRWWHSVATLFSVDVWAYISVTGLFVVVFMIILFVSTSSYFNRIVLFLGAVITTILLLISLSASNWLNSQSEIPFAIVQEPSVYIKSSPNEQGKDLFILHEGTKVKVLTSEGGWKKIRIEDGNEGWLNQSSVEEI